MIQSIVFDTSSAPAYTIGTGAAGFQTMSLNQTGSVIVNSGVTNNELFNASIVMGTTNAANTATFTNNGSGTLTFAGNINSSLNVAINTSPVITVNGSGNTVISGAIDAYATTGFEGNLSLVKNGTGTLTLAGQTQAAITDYLTGTTITQGTLQIGSGAVQGNVIGNIADNATLAYNESSTANFVGSISGSGALNQIGSGLLVLRGVNSYAGKTTISSGTVQFAREVSLYNNTSASWTSSNIAVANGATLALNVGGAGQFTTGDVTTLLTNLDGSNAANNGLLSGSTIAFDTTGGTFTISNAIADTTGAAGGSIGLTKLGANTLVLSGPNTYTGKTTVKGGGTLQVGNGATGSIASTPLTFLNGGTFNVQEAAGSSQNVGALTFSSGDGVVQSTWGTSGTSTLTFASMAARTAGATGNFVISGGTAGTNNNIVLTGQATGFIDPGVFFGGSNYAFYDSAGFVRGINYGVDATSILSSGAPSITGSPSNLYVKTTGAVTNQATATFTTLNIYGTTNINFALTSGATLTVNGILKSGGTSSSTISGGTGITEGTAGGDLVIRTDTATDAMTISDNILDHGTSGLTKSGAGTLTLSGANTYAGVTTLAGGTLVANTEANMGVGNITFAGGALSTTLSGTASTLGSRFVNSTAPITVISTTGSGGGVYLLGMAASNTGGLTLLPTAGSTITLWGTNLYSGTTTIAGGGLIIMNTLEGLALPSVSPITFNGLGGTIQIQNAGRGTVMTNNFVNSTMPISMDIYASYINLQGNIDSTNTGGLTMTDSNHTALNVTNTGSFDLGLLGVNTYSGPTNVLYGFLQAGSTTGLSPNSTVIMANTISSPNTGYVTTLYLNSYSNTIASLSGGGTTGGWVNFGTGPATLTLGGDSTTTTFNGIMTGGGSFTKNGTGTMTLTGGSINTGVTTINSGVVSLTGGSSPGGLTFSSSATTTGVSTVTVTGTTGLAVGQIITGTGVPGNTMITGISGNTLTINTNSNTTQASTTITSSAYSGLGTGAIVVNNGGTLSLSGSALQYATGPMTINGAGYAGQTGAFVNAAGTNYYGNLLKLGSAATISSDAGTLNLTNTGTITGATFGLTLAGAGNGNLASVIGTTSGTLTKNGAGTWSLSGANTYTGTTTINNGVLNVDSTETAGTSGPLGESAAANAGSIVFAGGTLQYTNGVNNNDYSGRFSTAASQPISIDTNGASVNFATGLQGSGTTLTLNDTNATPGTLTLSASSSYTGLTTVTKGTLKLGISGAINSGNALTTGASGAFNLVGHNQTLGLLTNGGTVTSTGNPAPGATLTIGDGSTGAGNFTDDGSGGGLNIVWNQGASSSTLSGNFNTTGNITINANGAGNTALSGSVNTLGTLTNSGSSTGTTTISGVIGANVGILNGVNSVIQSSANSKLVLSNLNTFTLPVAINNGTVSINTVAALGSAQSLGESSSPVTLGVASTSSGALQYTGGTSTMYQGVDALGSGVNTIQNSGTGLLTLQGNLVKDGTVLNLNGGANGINVTGTISGPSANSDLDITGGVTTLSTLATYEGPTNISGGGTLANNVSGGALPADTTVNIGSGATGGTLDLNGNNQTIAALNTSGSATTSDIVTNGVASAPHTLTVTNGGTFAGVIQDGATVGNTALTVSGGTMTLSGVNTYSGATNVSSGATLIVPGSLAAGSSVIINGTLAGAGAAVEGTLHGPVSLASGGAINLVDNVIGTLSVGSLSSTGGATITFEIGGVTTATDQITAGTLTVAGTTTIDIANLVGTSTLTAGNYDLINYTTLGGGALSNFSLSTTSLDGKTLSLSSLASGELVLTVSGGAATPTTYNLNAGVANARVIKGGSTTVTATITNAGGAGADTLNYTGLTTNGSLSGGLPKSGGPIALGGNDSGTATLSVGNTTGNQTITPTVSTATNATISGNATLGTVGTATVDVVANRVVTAAPVNFGRVLVGHAISASSALSTTGDDLNNTRVTVGTAGADANGISATGGTNPTYNSASVTDTRTVGGTFSTAGSVSANLTLATTGEGLTGEAPQNVTLGYSADPVNLRVINNGAVTNLGLLHNGATVSATTANAFSSTGTHDTTTDVSVAGGTGLPAINGVTLTGGGTTFNGTVSTLVNGSTQTLGGTIINNTGGTTTGTFNLAATTLETGLGDTYAPVAVAYTANVYTGKGVWAGTGTGGSWGATPGAGTWTAAGGTPGVTTGFNGVDTATFGNVASQSTQLVTLDGANPNVNAVTLNGTTTAYTLAQGTGGAITLDGITPAIHSSGLAQTISAPVALATNTTVDVAAADQLTISGVISGPTSSLTTTPGTGTTILTNANTYGGGTFVNTGTLYANGGVAGTSSATGTGAISVAGSATLGGSGVIRPTTANAGITLASGATLISGGIQAAVGSSSHNTLAGAGLTLDNTLAGGKILDASIGSANLTFYLGAGNINNATIYDFASPNTNSTYMTVLGNTPGEITFAAGDTITVNDLTGNNNLQLNINTLYLLIQAGTTPNLLTDNNLYAGLTTTGGVIGGVLQNGWVTTPLTINGTAASENYATRLYLYNGDLEVVPEPGTWAMMIGGLAVLVFWQRRKNKMS